MEIASGKLLVLERKRELTKYVRRLNDFATKPFACTLRTARSRDLRIKLRKPKVEQRLCDIEERWAGWPKIIREVR